jgi:hypothetical protein
MAILDKTGEPRVDKTPRGNANLSLASLIEVVDYSSVRSSFGRMSNKSFIEMMSHEDASAREPWVKVRWINIGGVDWGVLSALALRYGQIIFCSFYTFEIEPFAGRLTSPRVGGCPPSTRSRTIEGGLLQSTPLSAYSLPRSHFQRRWDTRLYGSHHPPLLLSRAHGRR